MHSFALGMYFYFFYLDLFKTSKIKATFNQHIVYLKRKSQRDFQRGLILNGELETQN